MRGLWRLVELVGGKTVLALIFSKHRQNFLIFHGTLYDETAYYIFGI